MTRSKTIVTEVHITCYLDHAYFNPWRLLTEPQRNVLRKAESRCEDSGEMGIWCEECIFCSNFGAAVGEEVTT